MSLRCQVLSTVYVDGKAKANFGIDVVDGMSIDNVVTYIAGKIAEKNIEVRWMAEVAVFPDIHPDCPIVVRHYKKDLGGLAEMVPFDKYYDGLRTFTNHSFKVLINTTVLGKRRAVSDVKRINASTAVHAADQAAGGIARARKMPWVAEIDVFKKTKHQKKMHYSGAGDGSVESITQFRYDNIRFQGDGHDV